MYKETLSFDDVLLVPKKSHIESRREIDIGSELGENVFSLPIISSPMDTVTEQEMAIAMSRHGGLGVIHRYNYIKEQAKIVEKVRKESENAAAAVGVSGDFLERAKVVHDSGANILCVDVAHGHHVLMERALKTIKDCFGNSVHVMAGNVATDEAYLSLSQWGADSIRVGIGGGSICSTRIQTGHGMSTFQSVVACQWARKTSEYNVPIIADGGVKTPGDIVKAMAAGADFVMLGSMLAGTSESPGEKFVNSSGKAYKTYRGMASREAQEQWRGFASSLEGVSTTIPYKGSVKFILDDLSNNIRSGFSYSGARDKQELVDKCEFIIQTSASQIESSTHILNVR